MLFGPYSDPLKKRLNKLDNYETTARMSDLKEKLANIAIDLELKDRIENVMDFQCRVIGHYTIPRLIQILFFHDCISKDDLQFLQIILGKDPSWNKNTHPFMSALIFKDICLDIIHCDLVDKDFLIESILFVVENERNNFLNKCGKKYMKFITPSLEALGDSSEVIEEKVTSNYTPLYVELANKLSQIPKITYLSVEQSTTSLSRTPSPAISKTGIEPMGLSPSLLRISKKTL